MQCPGCAAPMTGLTVDGHLGTTVDVDLCAACQVIWFDRHESLQLSPGSTLRLFRMIAERKQTSPRPLHDPVKCPRCDLRLLLTNDRQRNTPFRYRRCAREHGRLITFFDFLREKDFVRPLSPQQLVDLRANVQTINCSNCGAPIDLVHASACVHCATPISMLDLAHIEAVAAHLQRADEASRTIDPMLPARLKHERDAVDALFLALRADATGARPSAFGLVEMGLQLLGHWFRGEP
jgi:Zn-finger nucleic acid-binding protein